MAESDNDIEFLDEDADIVQQCVQVQTVPSYQYEPPTEEKLLTPLLVERTPAEKKRKRKKIQEDDSDYDPRDDASSPPGSHKSKKKKQSMPSKKTKTYQKAPPNTIRRQYKKTRSVLGVESVPDRKKYNITIPDYDDPLCLPVKAIQTEESDVKRLNNWNNVCLEHFKHCDNLLKPERGDTSSSSRTMVFRNVVNKQTGKNETTIWSKTCVENIDGDKKSEIFQCVLPRYKEKKALTSFPMGPRKSKTYHVTDEVVLCKEYHKDGETLVVYKPQEYLSSVYKLVNPMEERKESKDGELDTDDREEDELKMYMKELACCKMCAPCFQSSWRGAGNTRSKPIGCPICGRTSFVTVYNLLAHFKTHSSRDMQKFKFVISSILAGVVDYHYKCRLCRNQFNSIKTLRRHVKTHQGTEMFLCEIGNHMTR